MVAGLLSMRTPSARRRAGQAAEILLMLGVSAGGVALSVAMFLNSSRPAVVQRVKANASYIYVQNSSLAPVRVELTELHSDTLCGSAVVRPARRERVRACSGYYGRLFYGGARPLTTFRGHVYEARWNGGWRMTLLNLS